MRLCVSPTPNQIMHFLYTLFKDLPPMLKMKIQFWFGCFELQKKKKRGEKINRFIHAAYWQITANLVRQRWDLASSFMRQKSDNNMTFDQTSPQVIQRMNKRKICIIYYIIVTTVSTYIGFGCFRCIGISLHQYSFHTYELQWIK